MVIDTMVFAYALIKVADRYEQAMSILATAEQIIVPDSLFAELGNVVWQWIKAESINLELGQEILVDAEGLVDILIPVHFLRKTALELAVKNDHPYYDTLFIAAAMRNNTHVLAFDRKMATKFPGHVILLN